MLCFHWNQTIYSGKLYGYSKWVACLLVFVNFKISFMSSLAREVRSDFDCHSLCNSLHFACSFVNSFAGFNNSLLLYPFN